jgi:hypothetical protein
VKSLIATCVERQEMQKTGLVIAIRPHTLKRSRGGWSHYTDTSEPVDGEVGTLQL